MAMVIMHCAYEHYPKYCIVAYGIALMLAASHRTAYVQGKGNAMLSGRERIMDASKWIRAIVQ